ncbi:hypothetical protein GCM10023185_30910 [Hymenobacter saemangeumensis]|uniref:Uncharacterized protein n=1 Tax=Hymenobacter saemangeumensis TaxID=1084522 RepID=A0ABP8IMT3_9BACT
MLKAFLAGALCCLLTLPANSQTIVIVSLYPGDVVKSRLVGIDTATYRRTRLAVQERDELRYSLYLQGQQVATANNQVAQCRGQLKAGEDDYAALAARTAQLEQMPKAKPLLLDGHTYTGAAGGVLVTLAALAAILLTH